MKLIYKIGYGIFLAAVVTIALLLLATLFPIKNNFQVKIVQSGSMEPAIKTGSIVIVKPVESYDVGMVVTFGKDTKTNVPTTHRILETRIVSGEMLYTTKGDANEDKDPQEIRQRDIVGKVLFDVPYMGYIIDLARKPAGFIVLIVVPALVVVYDEIQKIWREIKKIRAKKEDTFKNTGENV